MKNKNNCRRLIEIKQNNIGAAYPYLRLYNMSHNLFNMVPAHRKCLVAFSTISRQLSVMASTNTQSWTLQILVYLKKK